MVTFIAALDEAISHEEIGGLMAGGLTAAPGPSKPSAGLCAGSCGSGGDCGVVEAGGGARLDGGVDWLPGGAGPVPAACCCCCWAFNIFLYLERRFWNQIFT